MRHYLEPVLLVDYIHQGLSVHKIPTVVNQQVEPTGVDISSCACDVRRH